LKNEKNPRDVRGRGNNWGDVGKGGSTSETARRELIAFKMVASRAPK